MGFFSRPFKKRKQPRPSDKLKIVLNTDKDLSEEQRNAIFTIVRAGIEAEEDLGTIGLIIIMNADIYSGVILNRIKNGVEVIV